MRIVIGGAMIAGLICTATLAKDAKSLEFSVAVGEGGSIHLPDVDFRAEWSMLGTWSIAGDEGADGLHVVYTQPATIQHYREAGEFPDGAVLIKELLEAQTEDLTTGTVSYAADVSGWFVMVKSDEDRFPDNKLWGDGWGWAYFDPEDRKVTTTEEYVSECKGCHIPARETDWIYVRGYPVLKTE